jgi:hypothetical protein
MIYLKEYNNYDNEVAEICKKYGIRNWSIRDGLVDVDGHVHLSHRRLTKLPLKFGRVSGYFYCVGSELITLEGAPKEVVGNFSCGWNNLTTLEGAPKEVSGYFYCYYNNLTTLEGAPKEVGGNFSCGWNNLTTLEGAPKEVSGNFYCRYNKLTTLEGAPKEVGGYFSCSFNKLTTLDYMPNVRGDIYINNNPLPKEILNLPKDKLKDVIFDQDFYEIWRDGKLFEPRWRELKIDLGL